MPSTRMLARLALACLAVAGTAAAPGAMAAPGLGGCGSDVKLIPKVTGKAQGKANAGTMTLASSITCDSDQISARLAVQVLKDGKALPSLGGTQECAYSATTSCAALQVNGTVAVPARLAGTWIARVTTVYQGPAYSTFVFTSAPPEGCTYNGPSLTVTCTQDTTLVVK